MWIFSKVEGDETIKISVSQKEYDKHLKFYLKLYNYDFNGVDSEE